MVPLSRPLPSPLMSTGVRFPAKSSRKDCAARVARNGGSPLNRRQHVRLTFERNRVHHVPERVIQAMHRCVRFSSRSCRSTQTGGVVYCKARSSRRRKRTQTALTRCTYSDEPAIRENSRRQADRLAESASERARDRRLIGALLTTEQYARIKELERADMRARMARRRGSLAYGLIQLTARGTVP